MKIGGWRTRRVFERYAIVSQTDIAEAMRKLEVAITARYAHLAPNTLHAAVDLIRVPGYKPEQSIPKSITSTPRKIFTGRKSLAVSASK